MVRGYLRRGMSNDFDLPRESFEATVDSLMDEAREHMNDELHSTELTGDWPEFEIEESAQQIAHDLSSQVSDHRLDVSGHGRAWLNHKLIKAAIEAAFNYFKHHVDSQEAYNVSRGH